MLLFGDIYVFIPGGQNKYLSKLMPLARLMNQKRNGGTSAYFNKSVAKALPLLAKQSTRHAVLTDSQ